MNEEISLNNSDYFEISIGRRVKKIEVYQSKSRIPIYSANVFKPFGYLDNSNLDDFEHNYVLWGIDGNLEFDVKCKGIKFGTTDHCGTIKILDADIIPEYLVYQLELKKHELGFDRSLRASLFNIKLVNVNIPFNDNDTINVVEQQDIVSKYKIIKKIKNQLYLQFLELKKAYVELDKLNNTIDIPIHEIFNLSYTTNNSKFTKKFINDNVGNIPVYSASKIENFVNYGYVKDNLNGIKYFENCLTWNIDGSVGKAFHRKDRFSLSEKVIPLIINDEYYDQIDLDYVKYNMEQESIKYGFNFSNKAGKSKIKDMIISFPVKRDDLSKIDLEQQKKISSQYKQLEIYKNKILNLAKNIIDAQIIFN